MSPKYSLPSLGRSEYPRLRPLQACGLELVRKRKPKIGIRKKNEALRATPQRKSPSHAEKKFLLRNTEFVCMVNSYNISIL